MTIQKKDLVAVRDWVPGDRNFILSTWLKGLRYGNEWFEAIDSKVYFDFYHKVIETILAHPLTTVKVACLADDSDVILGYSVSTGPCLNWAFVKKEWRSIGIGRDLVSKEITTVTHLTSLGKSILRKHPELKFNPFALST
jgi:hypothetical protein